MVKILAPLSVSKVFSSTWPWNSKNYFFNTNSSIRNRSSEERFPLLSKFSLTLLATTLQNGQAHSNRLSVFDHFVGLTLKGLISFNPHTWGILEYKPTISDLTAIVLLGMAFQFFISCYNCSYFLHLALLHNFHSFRFSVYLLWRVLFPNQQ